MCIRDRFYYSCELLFTILMTNSYQIIRTLSILCSCMFLNTDERWPTDKFINRFDNQCSTNISYVLYIFIENYVDIPQRAFKVAKKLKMFTLIFYFIIIFVIFVAISWIQQSERVWTTPPLSSNILFWFVKAQVFHKYLVPYICLLYTSRCV